MRVGRSIPWFLAALVLSSCSESDAPDDETNPVRSLEISRILPAEDALAGAHIPTVDPATMNDAEIRKVLGPEPNCAFRYTSSGKPVLALTNAPAGGRPIGVVKLNGSLIRLRLANDRADRSENRLVMTSGPVWVSLSPLAIEELDGQAGERREMSLLFEVDSELKVGYRGYFSCRAAAPSVVTRPPRETTPEREATTQPKASGDDYVVKRLPNGLEVRVPRSAVDGQ